MRVTLQPMSETPHVICFGAAHWDVIARASAGGRGPDTPGSVETLPGGVALNAALGLASAGIAVSLVAAVGDDAEGRALIAFMERSGIGTAGILTYNHVPTGRYVAIERADGELVAAVADAAALDAMQPGHLALDGLTAARAWLIDANLPAAVIRAICGASARPALIADAVSQTKAVKLRAVLPQLDAIYCNRAEAEAICATGLNAARAAAEALVKRGARRAVVTDGALPAADAGAHGVVTLRPAATPIRSVTGAGDALMAAHLATWLLGGGPGEALAAGLAAAHRRAA